MQLLICPSVGDDLAAYVEDLKWTLDSTTGVVTIPPGPDNQIESTVVQESVQLSRMSPSADPICLAGHGTDLLLSQS